MKRFGLIGKKLGHSFSKKYFTEKFARLNLTASYDLYELSSINEFPEWVLTVENLIGLNVTIPYKTEVIPFLDQLSEEAEIIGAVNTIRKVGDKLIGYNTDSYGFYHSLKVWIGDIPIHSALILGTGGASRAVLFVLEKYLQVSDYYLVSRQPIGSKQIAYGELDNLDLNRYTLIINTTPIGMYPDIDQAPEFPYHLLNASHFVYDLIYNPEETLFLHHSKNAGAKVLNGMPMLIGQAERAWEIWTE